MHFIYYTRRDISIASHPIPSLRFVRIPRPIASLSLSLSLTLALTLVQYSSTNTLKMTLQLKNTSYLSIFVVRNALMHGERINMSKQPLISHSPVPSLSTCIAASGQAPYFTHPVEALLIDASLLSRSFTKTVYHQISYPHLATCLTSLLWCF